jgi:hypothetical protein
VVVVLLVELAGDSQRKRSLECNLKVVLLDKDRNWESVDRNVALKGTQEERGRRILKQRMTRPQHMTRVLLWSCSAMAHSTVYTWPSDVIREHHVPTNVLHAGRTSSLQGKTDETGGIEVVPA